MRQFAALLVGAILVFPLSAAAQTTSGSVPHTFTSGATTQPNVAGDTPMFAFATSPTSAAAAPYFVPSAASPEPSEPTPQEPYGVFKPYRLQLYIGYSFFRFYIASKPSTEESMNGLDLGAVYYPFSWQKLSLEGQFVGTYGSIYGDSSKFTVGMGGLRYSWLGEREVQWWVHGLVGGAKFLPQTAFGGQTAFVYELGGGADLGSHRRRWALRAEADMVGTRFFNTYQFSPRISGGILLKFGAH